MSPQNTPDISTFCLRWLKGKGWLLAAVCFWGFLIVLSTDAVPFVRGYKPWPPEWRWVYLRGQQPWVALAFFILSVPALWLIERIARAGGSMLASQEAIRSRAAGFVLLYCLLFAFQIAAALTRDRNIARLWAERTYISFANRFFTASLECQSLGGIWSGYWESIEEDPLSRIGTHPPGFVTCYTAIRRAVSALGWDRGGWVGASRRAIRPLDAADKLSDAELAGMILAIVLTPLFANLALIPLLDLIRRQWSRDVAIRTGTIYIFTPAVVLFVPCTDQLLLPLSSVALWAFALGCAARTGSAIGGGVALNGKTARVAAQVPAWRASWLYLLAAGAAVGVHSLFSHHFTVVAAALALWRILLIGREEIRARGLATEVRRMAGDLAIFLLPVAAIWLIVWGWLGYAYLPHWLYGMKAHAMGVTSARSYWAWLIWNVWDVALFLGLPVAAAVVCSARRLPRLWKSYVWALVIVLLAVDVSGKLRGETARILLFVFPMILPLAAPFFAEADKAPSRLRCLWFHLAAQLAAMAIFLRLQ